MNFKESVLEVEAIDISGDLVSFSDFKLKKVKAFMTTDKQLFKNHKDAVMHQRQFNVLEDVELFVDKFFNDLKPNDRIMVYNKLIEGLDDFHQIFVKHEYHLD